MIKNGVEQTNANSNSTNGYCDSGDEELVVSDDKIDKLQKAYSMILKIINPDLSDHILRDTPLRAAKAMHYLSKGLS